MNLDAVLAQSQKKVLLIDADMRRGHLDRFLGHERVPGLSELIVGQAKLGDVIRQTRIEHLSFIPTGRRRLVQSGASVRGFILNDVQPHHGYGYGYRYGYRYGYGYGYKAYRADQSETQSGVSDEKAQHS